MELQGPNWKVLKHRDLSETFQKYKDQNCNFQKKLGPKRSFIELEGPVCNFLEFQGAKMQFSETCYSVATVSSSPASFLANWFFRLLFRQTFDRTFGGLPVVKKIRKKYFRNRGNEYFTMVCPEIDFEGKKFDQKTIGTETRL